MRFDLNYHFVDYNNIERYYVDENHDIRKNPWYFIIIERET